MCGREEFKDRLRRIHFHVETLVISQVVDELLTVVRCGHRDVRVQVLCVTVVVFNDRDETHRPAPLLNFPCGEFVDDTVDVGHRDTVYPNLVVLVVGVGFSFLTHYATVVVDTKASLHYALVVRSETDKFSIDG